MAQREAARVFGMAQGTINGWVNRAKRQGLRILRSRRSLRTEYNICSNCARNNCSGGIDGRPTFAYILSNGAESFFRILSTMCGSAAADGPCALAALRKRS